MGKKKNPVYRRKKQNDARMNRVILIEAILLCVIVLVAAVFIIRDRMEKQAEEAGGTPEATAEETPGTGSEPSGEQQTEPSGSEVVANPNTGEPVQNVDPLTPDNFEVAPPFERTLQPTGDAVLDEANRQAAMYDYDAAIELLKNTSGYDSNQAWQDAVASYEEAKGKLVLWSDNTQIMHIFFHTLVVDVDTAFASAKKNDYNDVMTTVDEFCKIIQQMYDDGYVLVSLYDIARMEPQADGTEKMVMQEIWLPEGKKPFVMSQDDVSYYEYMTGHGFASRFVIDENGRVINEMDLADGTVLRGSYDLVPIMEDFLEAHPDFCYKGARGTIALTGYDGIFGYRTSDFWYAENCDYYISNEKNDREKANDHTSPNPNIEADKETAAQIAQCLKDMGWTFASHSWGHHDLGTLAYETMVWDTDIWEKEVEPLLGGNVDIIIFPKGADIGSWRGYEPDNERYLYLKQVGFDYFCNVDSNVYWVQKTDDYFRMGRRNLDGRRFWEAVLTPENNRIGDLIPDVNALIDPARPAWEE